MHITLKFAVVPQTYGRKKTGKYLCQIGDRVFEAGSKEEVHNAVLQWLINSTFQHEIGMAAGEGRKSYICLSHPNWDTHTYTQANPDTVGVSQLINTAVTRRDIVQELNSCASNLQ